MTKKLSFLLLLIILAIAVFFRFYKLAEIPPGLYPDVAINGNDAVDALETGDLRWFYPENNGREGLFINLIAFSFAIFGVSIWALKFVPALIGTLTVLGMYLMVRELFSQYQEVGLPREVRLLKIEIIALSSTFFLATSFWHILFSRLGFRAIMVPFFLVWTFYFLFKGMHAARMTASEKRSLGLRPREIRTRPSEYEHPDDPNLKKTNSLVAIGYWLMAGLLFGLGFHTYIAFRVAPLILGIALLIEFYNYWPRFKSHIANRLSLFDSFKKIYVKDGWWKWDIFFLAIIIAVLPMVIYFYNNPQDFMGRSAQVSVFASENPVKQLAIGTVKTLGMFNVWGDCNWRHNYACWPELFWPVGILFLIGFVITIKEAIKPLFNVIARRNTSDDKAIPKNCHEITSSPTAPRNDEINNTGWSPTQVSLFLLTWFFAMLLPAILTNEGLPHALRAIGAIPPVFIFAGMGGTWIYERIKNLELRIKYIQKVFKVFLIVFLLWAVWNSYDKYFIHWGKNHEVRGAYTQHFVDIGNYLNSLPENTKKYVIVNEGGVLVPYPDGLPMPAQTVMFIEKTKNLKPNTIYLKPKQIDSIQIFTSQIQTIIVLMKYDESLLNSLKQNFLHGNIKQEGNIWTFQI